MKHKILLDTVGFKDKPTSCDAASISNRIGNHPSQLSIYEIAEAVQDGNTLVLIDLKGTQRKDDQFNSSSLLYVDMDNSLSPDEFMALTEEHNLPPALMYYSFSQIDFNKPNPPSHEKPGWRYRVIWQLLEPIAFRATYKAVLSGFINRFSGDGSCKDSARLVYGGKPDCVFHLNDIYVEPPTHKRVSKSDTNPIERKAVDLRDLNADQKKLLQRHIKTKWNQILLAQEQSRYMSLKTVVLGTREKHLYDFTFFPMMGLDFMTPELAVSIIELIVKSDDKLIYLYVDSYDKDYQAIVGKLSQWVMAQ